MFQPTAAELALILGLSESRIHALTRGGVLRQVEKAKYDLIESVQSYISYRYDGEEEEKDDLKEEQKLLIRAKRKKAELELELARGDIHKSEHVEAVLNDMLSAFRSKILAIPSKLAPRLANKDTLKIQKELERETSEALRELSEYNPEYFNQYNKDYINLSENNLFSDDIPEQVE